MDRQILKSAFVDKKVGLIICLEAYVVYNVNLKFIHLSPITWTQTTENRPWSKNLSFMYRMLFQVHLEHICLINVRQTK